MQTVFARKALLEKGWSDNVRLQVDGGRITSLATAVAPGAADQRVDILVSGLCNAHSHAFQRALVGRTEQRAPAGEDNFWSWRTRMYALANQVGPEHLAAIATQAYCEMLQAGYTAVAEFHYLHASPAANDDAMFKALQTAATTSGIRLVYVPVLYERAGFDDSRPNPHQQRFVMSLDEYLEHFERCRDKAGAGTTVAIAAHSLRAVSATSLQAIAKVAKENDLPMHLHIAEQTAEIEQCVAATGSRPVEHLLETCDVDARWCLVHATHINDAETAALAKSGAVVCLCPTTEANLGDGLFPLRRFLEQGGRIAIGSDSQVSIDPFEELRWLEYGQRLQTRTRNVAAIDRAHVGDELFARVLAGGAQAAALQPTGIAKGAGADLVELDGNSAVLAGLDDDSLLDGLVFSGHRSPVSRVMTAGEWCVIDGEHVEARLALAGYQTALETWQ
jgi:formiminoglutamate deiminase